MKIVLNIETKKLKIMRKKSEKSNLETKKSIFFLFGLLVTLSLTYMIFEWTITDIPNNKYNSKNMDKMCVEEMIPITQQELPKPPLPPKKSIVIEEIEVLDDKIKIDNTIEIPTFDVSEDTAFTFIPEEKEILEPIPYYKVETKPKFKDGEASTLINWITNNSDYPDICFEANISGTVWISFVINETGKIINVEVIRSVDTYLDNEALRVIKSMPNWTPGIQAGKNVPVPYQLPVKFVLY